MFFEKIVYILKFFRFFSNISSMRSTFSGIEIWTIFWWDKRGYWTTRLFVGVITIISKSTLTKKIKNFSTFITDRKTNASFFCRIKLFVRLLKPTSLRTKFSRIQHLRHLDESLESPVGHSHGSLTTVWCCSCSSYVDRSDGCIVRAYANPASCNHPVAVCCRSIQFLFTEYYNSRRCWRSSI